MVILNKQRRINKFKKELKHLTIRNDCVFNGKNERINNLIESIKNDLKILGEDI